MNACTSQLPETKPRYVMGVGYPEDLVVSVALGADMFDCVWPTRTAVRSWHIRYFELLLTSSAFRQRNNFFWQLEPATRLLRL